MTEQSEPHGPLAVGIARGADLVDVSPDTIRRAIRKTTDDGVFPPPLAAKRTPAGYRIRVTHLSAWFDSLPDA